MTDSRRVVPPFRMRGVFMIDLKLDPVDGSQRADAVPSLIRHIRRLRPAKIIVIKATAYDAAYYAQPRLACPSRAGSVSG
jgi:hypothetical protein